MADATGNIDAKNYGFDVPVEKKAFFLKGLDNYDWGIKDRMSRIFDSKSGNTVMLAFDHGYIMGPTSGLERIDLGILPLTEYADCLMCTRGVLRSCVPPEVNKPISLRVSAGTTVLTELNDECLMDIQDAISLNASAMAAMVSVGGKYEATTIRNLTKLVDLGMKYSIPVLGVTAVGKDLARDARYISMATRVCAENGATFVKTYYCEKDFAKVVAACPVPIVIAGGKKVPEDEALQVAYNAINDGASGVDMGRNVFQAGDPIAMIKAVRAVVHNGEKADKAFQMYNDLKK
jgi:putative autoinducer-2 (AI-2) aldolase